MADTPEIISIAARIAEIAAEKPQAPALSFEGETFTWDQFHRRTNRIAHALAARGVRQGDFVTIGLPNSAGFIEACVGAWKIGATPQPVSHRLPLHELEAIVELAQPALVIARPGMDAPRPRADVAELLAESDNEAALPDIIAPVWKAPTSGGSTGRPKLILSGQAGVWTRVTPGGYRTHPDDVMVMPGPMYHNGPFTAAFGGLYQGAHLILMARFDPEEVLKAVARHQATWLYLVPTMMGRIWRLPENVKAQYDVASLRTVWHLAAPCPPWLKEAFINWLGPEVIMELYAGTEAQAVTIITGTEWQAHRGSVGKVAFGEMKAFDGNGKELPPRETGEIFMRRPEGMPASYKYLGATARTLPGGWESLGDIGWFDEEGYLYLADRRTDMILVGGSNVYPAEIEAALDEHPLVQSSCVIGLPDEDMGNAVHAIVQPRPGLDEADLRVHMAAALVTYKQPRSYEFVDTPLRDDAGKIRRTQLRDERIKARS
jgi:bile acid-coenzyme A ligase